MRWPFWAAIVIQAATSSTDGCGESGSSGPSAPIPITITIEPSDSILLAVGDTVPVTATARDARSSTTITAITRTWTVRNTTVATLGTRAGVTGQARIDYMTHDSRNVVVEARAPGTTIVAVVAMEALAIQVPAILCWSSSVRLVTSRCW